MFAQMKILRDFCICNLTFLLSQSKPLIQRPHLTNSEENSASRTAVPAFLRSLLVNHSKNYHRTWAFPNRLHPPTFAPLLLPTKTRGGITTHIILPAKRKPSFPKVTIAVSAIATVLDAGTTSFPSLRLRFCFSPSLLSISSSEATPFGHECRTDWMNLSLPRLRPSLRDR